MATSYTVKLPDGNEYGPVDLGTLRSWHEEGRIAPDTWVWPDGSPEWLTLMDVLAGAGESAPGPEGPLRFKDEPTEKKAPAPRGTVRRAPVRVQPAARRRPQGLILGAAALLAIVGGVLAYSFLVPKERVGDRMREDALADRRFVDAEFGVKLELPEAWVLLSPQSTVFVAPEARARLAQPSVGALGALWIEALPPGVTTLDAFIDKVVDLRRALVSDYREMGRVEASVGGRPARRLQASWIEDGKEQRVTILATRDAWAYVALMAWGPSRVQTVQQDLEALGRGFQVSGILEAKVKAAADAIQAEVPELSRASLELILRDRLGSGGTAEEAADASVRAVSQGLPALTREEASELQQIYARVYDPMPEADRQRLAAWLRELRAGRKAAAPDEAVALRQMLKDALVAQPEEARQRLQALNEKAIGAAYALR
jgi:hypothetical protein